MFNTDPLSNQAEAEIEEDNYESFQGLADLDQCDAQQEIDKVTYTQSSFYFSPIIVVAILSFCFVKIKKTCF